MPRGPRAGALGLLAALAWTSLAWPQDGGPRFHQVLSASSSDGLTFTHDGVVLLDQASVPAAIALEDGSKCRGCGQGIGYFGTTDVLRRLHRFSPSLEATELGEVQAEIGGSSEGSPP